VQKADLVEQGVRWQEQKLVRLVVRRLLGLGRQNILAETAVQQQQMKLLLVAEVLLDHMEQEIRLLTQAERERDIRLVALAVLDMVALED
jgi:hypothetical protein